MNISTDIMPPQAHTFLAGLPIPQQQQVLKWWKRGYQRTCLEKGVVSVSKTSGMRSERVVEIKPDGTYSRRFLRA